MHSGMHVQEDLCPPPSSPLQCMVQEQIQEWYVQAFGQVENGTTGAIALADEPDAAEASLDEAAEMPQDSHRKQQKVLSPIFGSSWALLGEQHEQHCYGLCRPLVWHAKMLTGRLDAAQTCIARSQSFYIVSMQKQFHPMQAKKSRKETRSSNPYVLAAMAELASHGGGSSLKRESLPRDGRGTGADVSNEGADDDLSSDDDSGNDLDDFIVCKPGRNYQALFAQQFKYSCTEPRSIFRRCL